MGLRLSRRVELQVERQQLGQSLLVRDPRVPPVSRRHGGIEGGMGVGEPLRAVVVQVGQRAGLQRLLRLGVRATGRFG